MFPTFSVLLRPGLFALATIASMVSSSAAGPDDASFFSREVWPLLETRCVGCHHDDVREGGLNLATRDGLLAGGSRGQAIDTVSPDASVLTQIIQKDAHPRMPLDEEPLSDDEIDVLTRWVRGGAMYGRKDRSFALAAARYRWVDDKLEMVREVATAPIASPWGIGRYVPAWPLTIGGLILALISVPMHRRHRRNPKCAPPPAALFWVTGLVVVHGYLLLTHYRERLNPLTLRGAQQQVHLMFGNPPVPVNMDRSPSLRRVYYRGNDERSPDMFNGGNYLTSTFEVCLVDAGGDPLRIGSTVSANQSPRLRLVVDRAPHTPNVLYDPEMMKMIFLTQEADLDAATHADDVVVPTMTRPWQQWVAEIELDTCLAEGRHEQLVYLWQVRRDGDLVTLPKMHYAAKVELDIENGIIQPTSEIWFNAMRYTQPFVNLSMPPDQWLSTEPIPPLPGPNVQSAELLGLAEHLGKPR